MVWLVILVSFCESSLLGHLEAQKTGGTYVIEVTEWNSEVKFDLRGRLAATLTFEATKKGVRGDMHMDTRIIKVAGLKSEVIIPPRLFGGRHDLGGHHGC